MAKQPSSAANFIGSNRSRAQLAKRLRKQTGALTTAVVNQIEQEYDWFDSLNAKSRSWISVMVKGGIDLFVEWFSASQMVELNRLFNLAPPELARSISLDQTVDIIRSTIDVVEHEIVEMVSRGERESLGQAVTYFSREVAFASAKVYARAAERRGAWDDRMETMVVDAIVRGDSDDSLLSRASALGWASGPVVVAVGIAPKTINLSALRLEAAKQQLTVLAAVQGNRLILVLPADEPGTPMQPATSKALNLVEDFFAPSPIVLGPVVEGIEIASRSAQEAMAGARCVAAWPEGPRVLSSAQLLPERVLNQDQLAIDTLLLEVYRPLVDAGGDLLLTCVTFLDNSGSIEASARALFVHANTVRYRIKRIQDVTGYSPSEPRGNFTLRLAITLGRLHNR